ncbi:MAG: bifunctional diaminohydroxyphosphoribosylaminopyrimidine deaminase/5-amino-6-(5-phosphoribosylamino)uracil reductase RibD [Bacteroidota bacterium]
MNHQLYMQRCIELAQNGAGSVSPNPLVGCIIVHNNIVIGEGWHQQFGQAHAEVNAIAAVQDKSLLNEATLYVNLEPCNHFGKTPPCADLIIQHQIKQVVVGIVDPFEKVAGNGISKLEAAGIHVTVGVLEKECRFLNRRFIKFVTQHKPYVILKWAQTHNGYIAPDAGKLTAEEFEQQRHITGFTIQKLVHKWRTEEDAIMVGTNTALLDNPALNARAWHGKNPIRIVIDRTLRLPDSLKLFDKSIPTIVFTEQQKESAKNLTFVQIDFSKNWFEDILNHLYQNQIQSLIVEGGSQLLNTIIDANLWDEAIQFISPKTINDGVKAPFINGINYQSDTIDGVTANWLLAPQN